MRNTTKLLMALILAVVVLTAIVSQLRAYALHGGDPFSTFGPNADEVTIKIYSNIYEEIDALLRGEIQIPDSRLPPDIILIPEAPVHSELVEEIGMFQVDFNHANTLWGIPFENGNNPAGRNIRAAFAHMIDKEAFIANDLGGMASKMDTAVPNPLGVAVCTSANSGGVCDPGGFDDIHSAVSAYDVARDPTATPRVGSADWTAARDHLIAAGFVDGDGDGYVRVQGEPAIFLIRRDDSKRLALGNAIVLGMTSLFDPDDNDPAVVGPVAESAIFKVIRGSAVEIIPIVFDVFPAADWHIYTGGWTLSRDTDYLYQLYNSNNAGLECAGSRTGFVYNYIFYCTAANDEATANIEFATIIDDGIRANDNDAIDWTHRAQLIQGRDLNVIPVWTERGMMAYASELRGVVNQAGFGVNSLFTFLQGYHTGLGPGVSQDLAYGFASSPEHLSWFHAYGYRDVEVLNKVYDTLLRFNPYSIQEDFSWLALDWAVNPPLAYKPPLGTKMTLRFALNPHATFHDGVPVSGQDVRETILSFRDLSAPLFTAQTAPVLEVTNAEGRLPTSLDRTVDAHLNVQSIFLLRGIGGLPILPLHVWDVDRDGGITSRDCTTNGTYDPVSGLWSGGVCTAPLVGLTGSGPFVFVGSNTGVQNPGVGGSILLRKYDSIPTSPGMTPRTAQYRASFASYDQWLWADFDRDGQVTILDVARLGQCYLRAEGSPSPRCPNPSYWNYNHETNNLVDIADIGRAGVWYRQRWVSDMIVPATFERALWGYSYDEEGRQYASFELGGLGTGTAVQPLGASTWIRVGQADTLVIRNLGAVTVTIRSYPDEDPSLATETVIVPGASSFFTNAMVRITGKLIAQGALSN